MYIHILKNSISTFIKKSIYHLRRESLLYIYIASKGNNIIKLSDNKIWLSDYSLVINAALSSCLINLLINISLYICIIDIVQCMIVKSTTHSVHFSTELLAF